MLFTSSTKSLKISKQIDIARCKGHWHSLPDLTRRYVKHNPEGAALEQTVLAEVGLVRLGQTDKPWSIKQTHTIQNQLQSVFELNEDISGELKESAKVILARLFFGSQEYEQALALLGAISLLNAQSNGYSFILYYQSLVVKAMSMEAMGDMEACLQLYEYTSRLLYDRQPIKDLTLIEWAEEALYRANQLVLTNTFSFVVDNERTLNLLRSYHQATCNQPVTWRTERRMGTTLIMIKFLSKLYHNGVYTPYSSNSVNESPTNGLTDNYDDQKAFVEEITQLYTICELMLLATTPSSTSRESNSMILELIELLAADLEWILEKKEDWMGYKELLQRTAEKTFNSPSILRLLFLTNIRLGDYEEAPHALESYLQLVGVVSQNDIEGRQDGNAPVQDNCGHYLPLPTACKHTAKITHRLSSTGMNDQVNMRMESIKHQVDILIKAMGMFYSDLKNGIKAVEMADLALALVQEHGPTDLDSQQIAEVYHSSGVSYGLLASQLIDSRLRPSYHEKALHLLEQANTMASNSWRTLYSLARQHAEMRNIDQAIQSVRCSLNINMDYLPSWHLLALALSCPGQKGQSQALSVASAGLNILPKQINTSITSDHLEQHLLLKMTYSRLLCASEGPERALEEHTSLLKLYGKWSSNKSCSAILCGTEKSTSIRNGSWYGKVSHGGEDKAPRKMVISGPLGNVTPTVSSSSIKQYPTSTTSSSSSLTTTTAMKSNKFRRRRSASSSMIGHLESSTINGLTNCDSASMLSAYTTISGDEHRTQSLVPHKSPPLRKYASNSMLKIPTSGHQSALSWHNVHPSSSRSTSLQPSPSQSNHRMNRSGSNNSISKQSTTGNERVTSRYNSMYSFQSGTSSGGHTSMAPASLNGSFNSATSPISPSIPRASLFTSHRHESIITTSDYLQQQNQYSRLCELWLMSAEWYFELSEWDEAVKAISEAESICPTHPDVWCLLGKINHNRVKCCTNDDGWEQKSASAIQFFEKGLLLQPEHIENQIELAKLYMEQRDMIMAEGILNSITEGSGWNSPEAWFLLGQVYQETNRASQTNDCLFYALELESFKPIVSFDILPRAV